MDTEETTDHRDAVMALEQRYMKLLQEKIATLEDDLYRSDSEGGREDRYSERGETEDSEDEDRKNEGDEKSRVRYCREVYDSRYGMREEFIKKPKDFSSKIGIWDEFDDETDKGYAITWRIPDQRRQDNDRPTLLIEARGLRQVLKSINKGDVIYSWESAKVDIPYPYALIYHNEDALREQARDCDERTQKDIEILLDEVNKQLRVERNDAKKLIEQGEITFDLLWTIFYYGQTIVKKDVFGKCPQLLVVSLVGIPVGEITDKDEFWLLVQYIDHDGTNYVYAQAETTIKHFKGTKRITELELVPLPIWAGPVGSKNHQKFIETLTERGKTFEKLCTGRAEEGFGEM